MLKKIGYYDINIKRINLAHKFILDGKNKCEYPDGRKYYGLIFAISGEAKYKFYHQKSITIKQGDILLLLPKAAYSIEVKEEFEHYTVNFEINEENSDMKFFSDCYCVFSFDSTQQIHYIFEKLISSWMSRQPFCNIHSLSYLYELFGTIFTKQFEKDNSTKMYLRIQPAREYIQKNFNSEINLKLLAKYSHMSVTNFRREWLKQYVESALKYRDNIRLSYAKQYLISGYYTVSEIAEKCGFCDTNYFIRFFKKHVGVTPGNFEKKYKNTR